ncbi:MAG: arylesterase [Alphaproteobacteria bacterium]|nr:arylesterase [Alphaproteobacteria bacterium]
MNNHFVSKRYAVLPKFFKSLALVPAICLLIFGGAKNVVAASAQKILVLGDSLSAGYGLPAGEAFPVQLGIKLRAMGYNVKMLNGGVSGDTSAGGRARLNWALADKPHFAIIELGANDGLRGLDSGAMRNNLDDIIVRLKAAGIGVLLTGMRAPPNIGPEYGKAFNRVFPDLAQKHNVLLYPFFLEGVAAIPKLNQHDGIHPNPAGVAVIVDRIMPFVVRLLKGNEKSGTPQK